VEHRAGTSPWEETALISWLVARDALESLGRKGGTHARTVETCFSALAVRRLGFPQTTPEALALGFRKLKILRRFGRNPDISHQRE
jgi:hypothetical protein